MRKIFLFASLLFLLSAGYAFGAEPCIAHQFESQKEDGPDTTKVRPSDWNDCHEEPPKVLTFTVGCTNCAVLADADDHASFWFNATERTLTITQVVCKSDAGNPTIQLQRDDGSATSMFTTALTCDATPTGTDGTDGILTSFVSGENVISPAHWLDYLTVTAGGVAKKLTISIKMTVSVS